MASRKYELIIWWSAEDEVFVVEVPELPGCVAHGETPEQAVKNVGDAIDLWIEVAKAHGESIPEPKGRRVEIA